LVERVPGRALLVDDEFFGSKLEMVYDCSTHIIQIYSSWLVVTGTMEFYDFPFGWGNMAKNFRYW
jgi:hypothetical protein